MARTIVYRVKTPAGAWQRAVIDDTALPQNITGLVAGETYQVDTGKGTLVDVTPLNTFTLETFTGTPVVTGPGEYELTVTAPAYLASYNPGGGAGVYTWDTTELATGPKVLYPGSINAASYNVGNTINLVNPAFGVGSGTVDVFYRVYDDGVEIYDGATLSFDTTSIVAASSVSVRSYMVDQNGEGPEATILTFTIGAAVLPIARLANTQLIYSGTSGLASPQASSSIAAASGSNRLALLLVGWRGNSVGLSSISATWGAQSFEDYGGDGLGAFNAHSRLFFMRDANIPGTSQAITITYAGDSTLGMTVDLIQYENVNQTTPFGTRVSGQISANTSRDVSLTMTQTDSLLIIHMLKRGAASPFTVSSGTELFDKNTPSTAWYGTCAVEELVGATGVRTVTFTTGNSETHGYSAVEMFKA
jgi:hypothetical protein